VASDGRWHGCGTSKVVVVRVTKKERHPDILRVSGAQRGGERRRPN
jgi:hypothetical protein